jgi:GNAT superfamily N-acetyltransferase
VEIPVGYSLTESLAAIDLVAVHSLLAESYWVPGIAFERVERAAAGSSLVLGANYDRTTVGYLRVVSDRATFGWICDVIVHPDHQGRGLAQAMVAYALNHPAHQGFRRWILATRDAQSLYEKCGFELIPNPESWMIFRPAGSFDPFAVAT